MVEIVNEIVSDIAVKVLEELGSRFFQEFSLVWGVPNDLKKLESTAVAIEAVLFDAGQKQASDARLRTWLRELRDVLRDAEEVLGDVQYRNVRKFFSGSNPLVFRFKMAHKIKHIRKRLDDIAADKSRFSLAERLED